MIVFLLTYQFLSATSFYVATHGNDNDPGTFTQPWKTIQKACNAATPGSTVYIMQGTYYEKITVSVSGTPGNYITFTNYNNDTVIIDGTALPGITITSGIEREGIIDLNRMVYLFE